MVGKRFVVVRSHDKARKHYTVFVICFPVDDPAIACYSPQPGTILYLDPLSTSNTRVPKLRARALKAWALS
jgi:hypothetical protein